ncbi:MAG: zinc-dependent metalloprotease [Acidimicrobiia bacterium]|nr:zinc-dependent metalloprotease [Acidimicrobiia bacterium]
MSESTSIDWDLARTIAAKVNRNEPEVVGEERSRMDADFEEFTALAEELVGAETGLRSLDGDARGRVADRADWVDANIRSFQRLLKPMLEQMEDKMGGPFSAVGPKVAGAELGMLLGWMSTRVLGQYDLLVIEDENPEQQDIVYYVGSNVAALEKRFAFPERDFRLWLALHEVTHRAQFTGVPWMREHFLGLVNSTMEEVDPDPQRFIDGLRRALDAKKAGEDPLADGGLTAVFASEKQRESLEQIGGLMSLLEGHGDVTMDRAGEGVVMNAERFGRVLRQRRQNASKFVALIQRLAGLEAKMKQYAQGEAFIEAVEDHGGRELIDRVWEGPTMLPLLAEIREPEQWISRMQPVEQVA